MTALPMISAAGWAIEPPDLWTQRLPSAFSDRAPKLTNFDGSLAWQVGDRIGEPLRSVQAFYRKDAELTADLVSSLASVEGRKSIQARDEVDGEVLYGLSDVWTLINATEDRDFILACYAAYNSWLGEFCSKCPERFIGVAKVPTTGIEDATQELIRAIDELGLRGAVLDSWPSGTHPDGPPAIESAAFWEAAMSRHIPVSIHQSLSKSAANTGPKMYGGYAPDLWADLTMIVYGGVCDNYPDLRFVVVTPGPGWAPSIFEGANESYMRTAGKRQVELGRPDLMPADYLRKNFWYTVQRDRFSILNREYFGRMHLMWGTFTGSPDAICPNNRQEFARTTAGLPDEDLRCLSHDVVSRLYGLNGAKPFTPQELEAFDRYELL